ncbi:hypothetical protein ACJJTC_003265 [Scirpophaga incertulas]
MCDVQSLIDRQLGFYCRTNYDIILKRLVVSGEESFYGLQSSAQVATFDQDPPIFACRFSEAPGYEHILALANENGRVAIQDISTEVSANNIQGFQCHHNAVFDLAWMPGYTNIVTVSGDHTACLWDLGSGTPKKLQVFSNHTKSLKTAVFRPTEPNIFATGARDGNILVWDIRANNQPSSVILKPDNCLMNCHSSFSPKTPGSHSKRSRPDSRRAVSITGLAFQGHDTLLSCGECDGSIKVWDLRKNYSTYSRRPLPKHCIPYCGGSTRLGYAHLAVYGARLYASCLDGVIYCYNVAGTRPERRYVGHDSGSFYIKTALSSDGQYLVSGSSDRYAYVWNVREDWPIVRLAGHRAEVTCAAWAPKQLALVTCGDDARHFIWRFGSANDFSEESGNTRPRAESVPNAPDIIKRVAVTPHSQKPRTSQKSRPAKRCLTDLMVDAAPAKRARHESTPPRKRANNEVRVEHTPPKQKCIEEVPTSPQLIPADWGYLPQPGSFMTPTKNYEKSCCRKLSPRSPRAVAVKVSPTKVRVIAFNTPTKNLPNFVLNGEAPHLRLMSPAKKRKEAPNWLTLISREKRAKNPEGIDTIPAPASPKESTQRLTEKTPKSGKNNKTLHKYFTVYKKDSVLN